MKNKKNKNSKDKQSLDSDDLFEELKQKEGSATTKFDMLDFFSKDNCTAYYFGKLPIEQKGYVCSVCDKKKPNSTVSIPKLKVTVPDLSKPIAAEKGFTAKWKKVSAATGYQIQYALNSKFTKSKKTVKITKAATTSKKITKLEAKKKYYVRIRAYKTVGEKTYYSEWGKSKTVTTKE